MSTLAAVGCDVTVTSITKIDPAEGLVALRMSSNVSGTLTSNSRLDRIDVERIDDAEKAGSIYTIHKIVTGSMRTVLLLGALPAGKYKLTEISGDRFHVDTGNKLPTFHVFPGKTTFLGTLIDHPEYNMALSHALYFAIDPREDNLLQILRNEFPKLGHAFTAPLLGWDSEFRGEGPFISFEFIKNNTAVINKPVMSSTGEIFSGSSFGQILKRDTGGNWARLDTGSIHEVITVSPINKNTLIAGGDSGLLKLSKDQGQTWQNLPALPVRGAIIFTGQDKSGIYYAVTRRANDAWLYTSTDIAKGNWKEVRNFQLSTNWNVPWSSAEISLVDNHLFMALPPHNFHSYNILKKKWHDSEAPFSWTSQIKMLPGGTVYAVGTTGILNSLFISSDYGKNWRELDTSTRSSNPVFIDKMNGYMTHSKFISIVKYDQVLHFTEDAGNTWQETGKLPTNQFRTLFAFSADTPVFLTTHNGSIYSSYDHGKTWNHERKISLKFRSAQKNISGAKPKKILSAIN
ncbi:MAG TPA: hypothetical protein ENJ08_10410 [Gammaproteobacteria bacterium]|nr:hypothetical protein [Gammaproteobacteria bacterium]